MQNNNREEKGKEIAQNNDQVKRIDAHRYQVKSQSNNGQYDVVSTESGWSCSCPDHTFRKICCKHIHAVEFSLKIREQVKKNVVIQPIEIHSCQFCKSDNIVKNAIRHNKYGDLQRYLCKSCNKRFSINLGFEKMKASPKDNHFSYATILYWWIIKECSKVPQLTRRRGFSCCNLQMDWQVCWIDEKIPRADDTTSKRHLESRWSIHKSQW